MSATNTPVKNLQNAIANLTKNEKVEDAKKSIIVELSKSNAARQKLKVDYSNDTANTNKTKLEDDLKKVLTGDFSKAVLMLLEATEVFEAQILHGSMKELGTDEALLIDIMCPKNAAELKLVVEEFNKQYKASLKQWVKDDTSGDFAKVLDQLYEREEKDADPELAKSDAIALYEAGEKKWGTDENKFIDIFTKRSFVQMLATFKQYKEKYSKDIEFIIQDEMSGDLAKSLLTIGNIYLLFFFYTCPSLI